MDRDLLLSMLYKAKNLLVEDEGIIKDMDALVIRNNNAQAEILQITNKSYKRLSFDEYVEDHPLPERGDFEEYKSDSSFSYSTGADKVFSIIAVIALILGALYTLLDVIPTILFALKFDFSEAGHRGLSALIDIGITLAVAGVIFAIGQLITWLIDRSEREKSSVIDQQRWEQEWVEYNQMLAQDEQELQENYMKAAQERDLQIKNSLNKDDERIMELAESIEKTSDEAKKYKDRHDEIWQELDNDVLEFYPPDYLYSEAAEAFYKSVYNMRADTIKEAVNQYVESQEWEKTRELQKQQIEAIEKSSKQQIKNANDIGARMGKLLAEMDASINRVGNGVDQLHDGMDRLNDSVQDVGDNISVQTQVIQKAATFAAIQRQYNAAQIINSQYELMSTIRNQGFLTRQTLT